jgi:hypothetical protein
MVLRYGKQLHKVITSAIDGEDSGDLGARVFDLSPEGVNFKVIVEKQGDFPTYVSSKFSFPATVNGLEESGLEYGYIGSTEVDSIFKFKSYDELKQMVNEHIFCKDEDSQRSESPIAQVLTSAAAPVPSSAPVQAEQPKPATQSDDSDIQDLLAGLDL